MMIQVAYVFVLKSLSKEYS